MKTKIIPFDLETAKKIQAGKIKGCIMCNNAVAYIIDLDMYFQSKECICAQICGNSGKYITNLYNTDGTDADCTMGYRLYIELQYSDNEPQFKPFDKVIVRNNDGCAWIVDIYSHPAINGKHWCIGGLCKYILPFEGNEHLLGTTDKPKED